MQAEVLMRANDPMWELGMRILGGHQQEDRIWEHTLRSLTDRYIDAEPVSTIITCVDRRMQWERATNIWHNAGIRPRFYLATSPFRHCRAAVWATRTL